uniref:RING-type E3 ubiquitin transferase n=1 Tax=Electrophorus electricus TaxID=8005 RepID=A0A4W4GLC4_ELEEL
MSNRLKVITFIFSFQIMMSTKMKVHVRKKSSSNPVSKTISKGASPDSKCPICLDQFKNISYVDKCLHRFCFRCIQEWSRNKAESYRYA